MFIGLLIILRFKGLFAFAFLQISTTMWTAWLLLHFLFALLNSGIPVREFSTASGANILLGPYCVINGRLGI